MRCQLGGWCRMHTIYSTFLKWMNAWSGYQRQYNLSLIFLQSKTKGNNVSCKPTYENCTAETLTSVVTTYFNLCRNLESRYKIFYKIGPRRDILFLSDKVLCAEMWYREIYNIAIAWNIFPVLRLKTSNLLTLVVSGNPMYEITYL